MEGPGHDRLRLDAAINRKDNLFIGEATGNAGGFSFAQWQFEVGKSDQRESSNPSSLPRPIVFL